MNQKKIGAFIAELRKEKNMTQQELADKLCVTNRAISNWETGRRIPEISILLLLCEILDVQVTEMLYGEKIEKKEITNKTNETIIKTIQNNKKKTNIIKIFIILFILLILLVPLIKYKIKYPKIEIYSINVNAVDDPPYLKNKSFTYKEQDIYFYGINGVQICDQKDNCYSLKSSLDHNQTSIEKIKEYLNKQLELGNNESGIMFDGGTFYYKNERNSIMFCNTLEGNNDIYFGLSEMVKDLKGDYCNRKISEVKSFTRTYHILEIKEKDEEKIKVTLQNNNEIETVELNKDTNLLVGKNYEFSFYAFNNFIDTIKNIFENCTFIEAKETDKLDYELINEKIIVNNLEQNISELNELDKVFMSIIPGTLTKTSADLLIKDYSGQHHIYGEWFRIDEYINDEWEELTPIHDNYGFNLIAYGVDINNELILKHNWEYIYGELKKGKYRIVTEADYLLISTEFIIN